MKNEDLMNRVWKRGDLIWMECLPGGVTIFLAQVVNHHDELVCDVYHPELGRCRMPDYYFLSLEDAAKLGYIKDAP